MLKIREGMLRIRDNRLWIRDNRLRIRDNNFVIKDFKHSSKNDGFRIMGSQALHYINKSHALNDNITLLSLVLKPKLAKSTKFAQLSKSFVMVNVEDNEEPSGSQFVVDGEYVPRIFFMGKHDKIIRLILVCVNSRLSIVSSTESQ